MAAPTWYNPTDQAIFTGGHQFVPQERFRLNEFTVPTTEEKQITETFGIPYTNAFTGGGGGGGSGPTFNYDSSRNYQPGGMYERNPLASGALDTMMNAQGEIVPNYNYGTTGETAPHPSNEMGRINTSSFTPLELSYMSELPSDYKGQDLSRMEKLNMMARNFKGVDSAYENYRTKGKLGKWAKTGVGMIPWLSQGLGAAANMLGLQMTGDRSDRQRWAVDNAGFGQGTGRDQFGVYTGGKTLMGDTADYKTRMQDKVDELKSFFYDSQGNPTGKRNSTLEAQLKDYEIKLGILDEDEKVNMATQKNIIDKRSRDYYRRENVRKETGEQGIYGLHQNEGTAAEDLKAAPAKTVHVAGPQWYHQGPDAPDTGRNTPGGGKGQSPTGGNVSGTPFAEGGRIGYNRGRVVNPGGYAGEDEGGILEWIKSKMGSESESNPTVFGTQDSLLNQGSIAQLQDAIKTYEAFMQMGELDEEQQADYELKLNQLSALTEGATQKAHGGSVGFKYGGLAGIL